MINALPHFRKRSRKFLALAAVAVLSGCAGNLMPYTASVRNLMPEEAVVMPPPGGPAMISVLEHQYSNAIEQRILLETQAKTAGQNYINAIFFGTRNYSPMNRNAMSYSLLTDTRIDEEMREELPGVAMTQSPYYVQNNYGPFGYAFGRGRGNDLCMYGWQQIRPGRDGLAALANNATIQIRVRFCEAGATEDDLLGIMYGYTINAAVEAYGWNPYGELASPPALLGEKGAPSYPRDTYDNREEKVSNTSKVLTKKVVRGSAPVASTTPRRRATQTANADEISVDVVPLSAASGPASAPYSAPAGNVIPGPMTGIAPPAIGTPPGVSSAGTIPAPGRQAADNPNPSSLQTGVAPSGSIPAPPCRLLPGSTTVTCE